MTPGARISAAIECLDEVFAGAPAEKALTAWARRSRFAGSKDRAAVRDHVFDALRARDSYAALGGGLAGRCVMIGLVRAQGLIADELFNGIGHAPSPLSEAEQVLHAQDWQWDMPDWCATKLQSAHPSSALEIAKALKSRAPVDLRVNTGKTTQLFAQEALAAEEITTTPIDMIPNGLRITANARRLKLSQAYLDGLVELQDAGSQALVEALPYKAKQKILDYCAGGGGKSLAMAARGNVVNFAHDVAQSRMKDIPTRAARAGVEITCLAADEVSKHAPYDLVLCDTPCSGSGAWRRSPDAKWRLTTERFDELLEIQEKILNSAQHLVTSDGFLSYATCSLFAEENEHQVNRFLENHANFKLISKQSWTPLDGCDGFFVATMQLKGE